MIVQTGIPIHVANKPVFDFLVEHFSDTVAYQDEGGQQHVKLLVPGSRRMIQLILDKNIVSLNKLAHELRKTKGHN